MDEISKNVLQDLTRPQCVALLEQHHFGRLAFVPRAGVMPQITPVNYLLDQDAVIFRSDPGSKLTAAIRDAAVAFEIDGIDDDKHTGWSVVITGHAVEVIAGAELNRLRETLFASWAPGAKNTLCADSPGARHRPPHNVDRTTIGLVWIARGHGRHRSTTLST